jgi:hypothetical protein
VTTRTYGILASVIGSALSAWWWTRRRSLRARPTGERSRDRGEVIFDNTPTAAAVSPEGII